MEEHLPSLFNPGNPDAFHEVPAPAPREPPAFHEAPHSAPGLWFFVQREGPCRVVRRCADLATVADASGPAWCSRWFRGSSLFSSPLFPFPRAVLLDLGASFSSLPFSRATWGFFPLSRASRPALVAERSLFPWHCSALGGGSGTPRLLFLFSFPPPPNSFVFTVSRGFAPERAAPPRTQGRLPGSLPFFLKFVCWKTASEGLPIMVFVSYNKPSVCVRLKTALSCSCLKGSLAQSRLSCSLSIDF